MEFSVTKANLSTKFWQLLIATDLYYKPDTMLVREIGRNSPFGEKNYTFLDLPSQNSLTFPLNTLSNNAMKLNPITEK